MWDLVVNTILFAVVAGIAYKTGVAAQPMSSETPKVQGPTNLQHIGPARTGYPQVRRPHLGYTV